MRVTVNRVDPDGLVEFSCSLGLGQGAWRGSQPAAEGPCDVELDIPATLIWGASIVTTDEPPSLQRFHDGETVLICRVLQLDELGVLTVDAGGLVLVETSGQPPAALHGNVRLVVPRLEVHPTGI